MMTAASAARGMRAITPASSAVAASNKMTVTMVASWVRAPASALTAVREKPPATGMVALAAAARLAAPRASSSRLALTVSPSRAANSLAIAALST